VTVQPKAQTAATPEELLRRASALVPTLKERAARTEQLRQLPPETVDDLIASGLIRIGVPKRFGGLDVDYELALEIGIELGRGCGATAWCYCLWAVHAWLIGHWPPVAQEEVFGNGPDVLCSSSFFPGGARIEPVEGGLRLSGRWEFSSGCDAATWLMLGAPDAGGPMWVLVPKLDYEIVDTWFASGLCGSGSKDICIEDAFVPAHRILREPFIAGGPDSTGWALHRQDRYGLPVRCLLGWDLLAPMIGMAQGAIDEFTNRYRGTSGAGKSAESVVTQIRLAEATAEVSAARALMREDVHGMLAKAARCGPFSPLEVAGYPRDRAFAAKLALQAVERLFEVSGGHALFQSDPLQRIHRDTIAASHRDNLILDLAGQQYGRLALEVDPAPNVGR
jgi:3-hydroxy-9,10-secoandrosta-1,3,5(10)-triene-9,17-dione monooxygenase